MGDIYDAGDHKVARIDQDGYVYSLHGSKKIGRVLDNGDVYNVKGYKIGHYSDDGKVYEETRCIATIKSDGKVYDYEQHRIGRVKGDHIYSGGAALALLVR